MATTVDQAFRELRSSLEITTPQASVVSTRQKRIREVLTSAMTVEDSFLTGSYARSTMIGPLKEADIDIFMVLHPSYYQHYNGQNGGPAGLLDYTKRSLLKTYTRTPDISRNGHAVTIRFDDFVVDVVVGFNRQGGGYIMANSIKNTWLSTDPKKHVEIVTAVNKRHNGNFVPLVKMIKGWNRSRLNSYFRSFHLEVLALEILGNVTISDFPSGCRYFFDKARTAIQGKNLDPAGYGDDVGSYIVGQVQVEEAVKKLARAFDYAVKAERFAALGQHRDAVMAWDGVFNEYFPAYG